MRIPWIKVEFHGNFTAWQAKWKGEAQNAAVFSADVEISPALPHREIHLPLNGSLDVI